MEIVVTSIIVFFYFCLFSTLFLKNKTLFLIVLISLFFINDFFSVQLDYLFEGLILYLLKAWKELLAILLLLITINRHSKNHLLNRFFIFKKVDFLVFLMIIHIFLVLYAILFRGNSVFESINESRAYFINLYIIVLFCYNYSSDKLDFHLIIKAVVLIVIINFGFASYNYFTFDGNYQSLWRYQFKIEREYLKLKESLFGFRSIQNDFVRGENLRASGFLISTLEYGITLAFIFVLSFISYVKLNYSRKILMILIMMISLIGIYTTQTRTAYGIVILAFMLYFSLVWIKKTYPLILIPTSFIFLTFVAIAFRVPGVDEASSYGRVIQYLEFFQNFEILGIGLGSSLRTTFDSFYLSVLTVFGVLGAFYLMIVFYPFGKILSFLKAQNYSMAGMNNHFGVLVISTVIFYSVSIFVLSIQYSVSSFQVFLLELFGFLIISSKNLERR